MYKHLKSDFGYVVNFYVLNCTELSLEVYAEKSKLYEILLYVQELKCSKKFAFVLNKELMVENYKYPL